MSQETGSARPRQVTTAVVMAVISSLVLILGLFDTLRRLRTPAMREVVDDFLAGAPGSSLGLETAQVVDLMRMLTFVSGALAAMGLVFAVFVLQRHRGARVGFTVVAGLSLLTVPVAGLMPFFLAVAALLLWSQPARDWYAGRSRVAADAPPPALEQERPVSGATASHQQGGEERPRPTVSSSHGPPPYGQPYGQALGQAPTNQAPTQAPTSGPPPEYFWQPGHAPPGYGQVDGVPVRRPVTVTIATVLTWLGAGATAVLMLVFMAVLGSGGDAFVEEFERAARESNVRLSAEEVLAAGWVVSGVLLGWSLVSMVLALLAFRRSNGARIALVVSAVLVALLSLVAIMSILSAVTLLMAAATVILLFTGGANEWYSRRSSDHRSGPPPSHPYGGHPPQDPSQRPHHTTSQRNQPW